MFEVMKKICFLLFVLVFPFAISAQIYADFENLPVVNGVGDIPTEKGWVLYDVDENTPSNTAFNGVPWIVKVLDDGNYVAASTSYYNPFGQSDDWLVTKQVTIPSSVGASLLFQLKGLNVRYLGKIQVLVSTTSNATSDFTKLGDDISVTGEFKTHKIDLTAYSGQSIYVAFRNISNNKFVLALDNIDLRLLQPDNVRVASIVMPDYILKNQDQEVGIAVENVGGNPISSIDFSWSYGTTTHTGSVSGLSIAPFEKDTVYLVNKLNYPHSQEEVLNVTATAVNGNQDSNQADNQAQFTFYGLSKIPSKKIVIEEMTGLWCGKCPRGIVAMETMYELYPDDFIGIAVHDNDPMQIEPYHGMLESHIERLVNGGVGLPGSMVGRRYFSGVRTDKWKAAYVDTKTTIGTPAEVDLVTSYDAASRTITAEITTSFYTALNNTDYRLSLIVVEDNVTGTPKDDYKQKNDWYNGNLGAMGGFENKPHFVYMPYDRVAISMLGGYTGVANVVPDNITDGETASYTFTYNLPNNSDPDEVWIVGLLIDGKTGFIINANEQKLGSNLAVENPIHMTVKHIKMYPNPTSDILMVSFDLKESTDVNLTVYGMMGKRIKKRVLNNLSGNQNIQLDVSNLATGEYLVALETDKGAVTKTIIVK